jgi:flagellar motor switch protein FliN/FliY
MEQVSTEAHPASFEELGAGVEADAPRDLRLLADINVELSVELGRSRLAMRKLLGLVPGSVIDLDRPADGAVDVLVNGRVVARGEIVIVDGEAGVRVTEIVSKA